MGCMVLSAISEIMFTLYTDVYGHGTPAGTS
jgi:hypothetical protein